ncbi:MAG: beta-ketoacyl synthase, partial [Bryobacteraceae bacterium]
YRAARVAVISSVTGQAVGREELQEAGYWRRQVRETVQFRRGMETLGEAGHRMYLEIGPGTTLLGLGRRCLDGREGEWLASLRRGQSDWRPMLESLGALYVRGTEVDWAGFDKPYERRRVSLPTYPFERQRYWLDARPARRTETGGHPLLGKRMELAGSPASSVWQTEIGIERLPYLADQR